MTKTGAAVAAAAVVFFALSILVGVQLVAVRSSIQEVLEQVEKIVQQITQTATRASDGAQATITTTRITLPDGTLEPLTDWMNRHDEAIRAWENS